MASNKELVENSILYTFSGLLTKGVNFLLLPFYTAFLTPKDYGIYSLISSFVSMAFYFVSLGLESALIRFYSAFKNDKEKLSRMIGTCVITVSISTSMFSTLCIIFRKFIAHTIMEGVSFSPYVMIALFELGCSSINILYRTVLRASGNGKKLTVSSLSVFFSTAIITILLISLFKYGAVGMLAAAALTQFAFLVYAVTDLIRNDMITFCIDLPLLKMLLKYSIPIIPHSMSTYIASFISKVFLNNAGSLSSVGIYNISTQFAAIIDTFQDSIGHAYRPWLNEILTEKNENTSNLIQKVSENLMRLYTIIFLGVALFVPDVIFLFLNNKYHGAWKIIPILSFAFSLKAIYYFYIYQCFFYPESAKFIFMISISASLLNIVSSYIMTTRFGMYGTATAQLVADLVRTISIVILAKKYSDIGYKFINLARQLIISWLFIVIGVLPGYIVNESSLDLRISSYKLVIFLVFIALVYLRHRKEINHYVKILKKRRSLKSE
jgi:O-antigen/teichoic acid export membrane protein